MRPSSAAVAALLALAPVAARAADPAPVVAAERAFAADGAAMGVKQSFLKHMAPDAIVLNPQPQLARAVYEAEPESPAKLVWWPLWAGMAASGDLGFTTGPYSVNGAPRGWYFTVWARQPDGSWKWIFDGGAPSDPTGAAPQGAPVAAAKDSAKSAGSPLKAMEQVAMAETALALAAESNTAAAYMAAAASDARFVGSHARPPASREALAAELATRAQQIDFSPLGGQASSAGDLAWTYGVARWTDASGKAVRGRYVRIWRDDLTGWRLVFDELLTDPPSKS